MASEYNALRKSVGWTVPTQISAYFALKNSLFVCSAHRGEMVVGAGRVVGDGHLAFTIMDIMVHPDFQHRYGIGAKIMLKLLSHIKDHSTPESDVYAMSVPDQELFYRRLGFVSRPTPSLGPGMSLPYEQLQKY
ncbi:GNAT family N-acetyltransferase [Burkholderia sp. Nafp2/4-1b]|uniref:GNAT family N-acetyltransferase n=1 Tax=Burkholderia sp. Nafp2/4-1b TaxID=2116686 RepID=UPI0013CEEEC8|nr:GNAT family N-acetyltransferase [Burkholderia sp. Nafp2/4-1b]